MPQTIEVKNKDIETMEKPQVLTAKNVCYYSEHYKRLEGFQGCNAIRSKAIKFVELNLIKYDPDSLAYGETEEKHNYICLPIPNYNKTTYRLTYNNLIKDFECSCQFYQTKLIKKEDPYCSHWLALYLYFRIKHWNKNV